MSASTRPITSPVQTAVQQLQSELAVANRILSKQEVFDAFGHVSQRTPWDPDHFMIARSMAPALVTPSDVIELDLNGDPIDPQMPQSYIERFIHAEIYRLRPDVHSVIHSHSPSVLPFSVSPEVPLRCICHTAGFIGQRAPIFEIRDHEGETSDLLIRNSRLGVALAACLGSETLVLMRGHGCTTVGKNLQQAVFHAVYAEVNARVQHKALQLGSPIYLSDGEAALATSTPEAVRRAYNLWISQVVIEPAAVCDQTVMV